MLAYAGPDTATSTKTCYAAHYDWFSLWAFPSRECASEVNQQSEQLE